jgi:hypothetical protein
MKKIVFISSALLALTTCVLLLQCNTKAPNSAIPSPKVSKPSTPQPQAACNCGTKPTGCSGMECIDKLFGGQNSKTFTITWLSCVDPNPSNSYCNGLNIQGTTSTLKLCYQPGSCDHVIAMISNPPSCLTCLPNPYCISLLVSCADADHFTMAGNETFPNDIITVTIAADPKISVTCGTPGNSYNCSGSF